MTSTPEPRLRSLAAHLCASPARVAKPLPTQLDHARSTVLDQDLARIAQLFYHDAAQAWQSFVGLPTWTYREAVVQHIRRLDESEKTNGAGWIKYCDQYRRHMKGIILDEFCDVDCSQSGVLKWAQRYQEDGEVNVPILCPESTAKLARLAEGIEALGKHRYSSERPCYPPGEVHDMEITDPRKNLITETNLTAVASRHMDADNPVQWIYHSPWIRQFLAGVLGCEHLYPYV